MGLLDKLFGRDSNEDAYFDLLVELGQMAVESPPRGVRLTRMVSVTRATDVLQNMRVELQLIEQAMQEEEDRVVTDKAFEDAERPELVELVEQNRAAILTLERRLSNLKKNVVGRQANMRYFLRALNAQDRKVQKYEEADELDKAEAERAVLKKMRLDRLRQERHLMDALEEMDMHLQGEGRAGEGLRAKMRLEELDQTQKERDQELFQILEDLDRQATAKEGQISETEEALAEALAEVGAELLSLRVPDPRLTGIYAELDEIGEKLAN